MDAEAPAPATPRLEPIPTLPIFFKLAGRRVVLAGGDPPVVWKAELLVAAGARVEIYAAAPCAALERLAQDAPATALTRRHWAVGDLAGAALAIGAIDDADEAHRFRTAAKAAGVPVNVVDKPAFCDFQFGTLVVRSPLVLAITTDGAIPVLGQALRMRLEALLPDRLRDWTRAALAWRSDVRDRRWDFAQRRRFWEIVAERALAPEAVLPDDAIKRQCFEAVDRGGTFAPLTMALVGSGSGDPDDLTSAAIRALQNASLLIHDPDVPAATVQLARREAEKRLATTDDDAIAFVLSHPPGDGRIVWLGTGDPTRCPRWQRRGETLAGQFPHLARVRGLDRCPRCADRCGPARQEGETLAR